MTDKKTYFLELRNKRKKAKEATEKMGDLELKEITLIRQELGNISAMGYMFCKMQLKNLGRDGIPGIDTKTFKGWRDSGFMVKKGEHSQIDGITWIKGGTKEGGDDEGFLYPKVYKLFHRNQVQAIGEQQEAEHKIEIKDEDIDNLDLQLVDTLIDAREMQTTPLQVAKQQELNFNW